jgi:integrase
MSAGFPAQSAAAMAVIAGLLAAIPSRLRSSPHLSTRQYAWIVRGWVREIGLNPAAYGTHTLRRTRAALIYRRTKNLRAVQLLLGHSKLESRISAATMKEASSRSMATSTTTAPTTSNVR